MYTQAFGEIHGRILNDEGTPVEMAAVRAFDGATVAGGCYSDERGIFKIKPLRPGLYDIEVNSIEFASMRINGIRVEPEKIYKTDDIILQPLELGPVIIKPKEKLISFDGSTLLSMDYKTFKNMPAFKGGDLKRMATAMSADIKTNRDGSELYFRGSRSGSVVYYIDGVKVRENPPPIPSSGISSYNVYTGGVPAKYGDSTGGIIVIETKSYLELYYEKLNAH